MGKNGSSDVLVVIPARWASTRFPGKPLALLNGKSMIEHVVERVRSARCAHAIVVATDDFRIAQACEHFHVEVVMTRADHATGTDRVEEAVSLWVARAGLSPAVVLNVQGDEPLLPAENVQRLVELMSAHTDAAMGTLACPCAEDERGNENVVKVVCRLDGRALYFSRAAIPIARDGSDSGGSVFLRKHIGIYAYRAEFLRTFVSLKQTPLELCEKLEQLRALEHGFDIVVGDGMPSFGVDTPEQAEQVSHMLASLGD